MQVTSPVGSLWIRSFCTKIAVNITILIHHHCKSSLGISIAFHLFNVVKGICKNVLYLKYIACLFVSRVGSEFKVFKFFKVPVRESNNLRQDGYDQRVQISGFCFVLK
jgi:hypothetical protein